MSTSQEKLEQRAEKYFAGLADPMPREIAEFARAELQKAAEIADLADKKFAFEALHIASEIRKLME